MKVHTLHVVNCDNLDALDIRQKLVQVIEKSGFKAVDQVNGKAAFKATGWNGPQFINIIKAAEKFYNVDILFDTSVVDPGVGL